MNIKLLGLYLSKNLHKSYPKIYFIQNQIEQIKELRAKKYLTSNCYDICYTELKQKDWSVCFQATIRLGLKYNIYAKLISQQLCLISFIL